jgi:hypothetical protein
VPPVAGQHDLQSDPWRLCLCHVAGQSRWTAAISVITMSAFCCQVCTYQCTSFLQMVNGSVTAQKVATLCSTNNGFVQTQLSPLIDGRDLCRLTPSNTVCCPCSALVLRNRKSHHVHQWQGPHSPFAMLYHDSNGTTVWTDVRLPSFG